MVATSMPMTASRGVKRIAVDSLGLAGLPSIEFNDVSTWIEHAKLLIVSMCPDSMFEMSRILTVIWIPFDAANLAHIVMPLFQSASFNRQHGTLVLYSL